MSIRIWILRNTPADRDPRTRRIALAGRDDTEIQAPCSIQTVGEASFRDVSGQGRQPKTRPETGTRGKASYPTETKQALSSALGPRRGTGAVNFRGAAKEEKPPSPQEPRRRKTVRRSGDRSLPRHRSPPRYRSPSRCGRESARRSCSLAPFLPPGSPTAPSPLVSMRPGTMPPLS